MGRLYFFLMFLFSLLVCVLAPTEYDHEYSVFCFVVSLFNIILYLIFRKKTNYFDFDNFFFVAYIFILFYYTAYMYEADPYRYVFYQLSFNEETLPLSAGLALLGLSGYIFGAMLVKERRVHRDAFYHHNKIKVSSTPFYVLSIAFLILYIVSGGYERIMKEYIAGGLETVEEGGAGQYFFIAFPAFLLSGLIVEFYNLKLLNSRKVVWSAISKLGIVTTAIVFLMFILIGSRTIPLQIILAVLGLYTMLYRPVSFSKFIGYIVTGFLFFALVGFVRNRREDKVFRPEDAAMDFIINNRNSYVAIEYVNTHGFSMGLSMLSPVLAPVPFAQALVVNLFDLDPDDMRSALITTKATFGEVGTWGLGTNIVADVYLAYGIIGVFILFPFLGYLVNKFRNDAHKSFAGLIFYTVLISYAVYLPRAEYFYFLRYFVWCYIFIMIGIKLQSRKNLVR